MVASSGLYSGISASHLHVVAGGRRIVEGASDSSGSTRTTTSSNGEAGTAMVNIELEQDQHYLLMRAAARQQHKRGVSEGVERRGGGQATHVQRVQEPVQKKTI